MDKIKRKLKVSCLEIETVEVKRRSLNPPFSFPIMWIIYYDV